MPLLAPPSLAERARWAVALYNDSVEYDKVGAYRRDRKAGIARYKNAPAARLRTDLEPVLKVYPDGTVQHSAAAYVLARYGVDVERNVRMMFASARMDRHPFDFDNAGPLPEALADVWLLRRSPTALARLVDMPSDGHVGEEQGDNLARALNATPDPVLRAAAKSAVGWSQLVWGVSEGALPKWAKVREKALLTRLRRDAKRYE